MPEREERRGPGRPVSGPPPEGAATTEASGRPVVGMPRTATASGAVAAPAATVVLVRDGERGLEVLLAKRSSTLEFHGGAWVFPGGRIDPEDYADDPDDVFA